MAEDMVDVKEKITEIVEKITKDEKLKEQFKKDPVKAVESTLGVDLPDDAVKKIVDGVKAKVTLESANDIASKLKKLF